VNGDRLLNRCWDYPNALKPITRQFDLFHICDHSYAHLVHILPSDRTGVYCHDLDAFRSLLEPTQEPRPPAYRAMAQHILTGLQQAALVFYSTDEIRRQLEHYRLVDPARLVHAPLGVAPEFTPDAIETLSDPPFILHVGSCIPRKRIDVLLAVFTQLRQRHPHLQLVKVGGTWSREQAQQVAQLGDAVQHYPQLSRSQIARLYRRAAVVLLTSEAEGFGLPLIEALSCGAIVVVSDLPVLREVSVGTAIYCSIGNINAWVETVDAVLRDRRLAPERSLRLASTRRYSWKTHAAKISQAYLRLIAESQVV
jgi:glycosyltransferase involved in cell wall biosynthesis